MKTNSACLLAVLLSLTAGPIVRADCGPSAKASGPLRVHPTNPRYFTDGTKNADGSLKAVYLTGSHTWNNLVDMDKADPPAPFDFGAYLDFLQRYGHNFIRLWTWDSVAWDSRANGKLGKDFVHHVCPAAVGADRAGQCPGRQAQVRPDEVQPRVFRPAADAGPCRRRAGDLRLRDAVRRLGPEPRQPSRARRRTAGLIAAIRSTRTTTSTASPAI